MAGESIPLHLLSRPAPLNEVPEERQQLNTCSRDEKKRGAGWGVTCKRVIFVHAGLYCTVELLWVKPFHFLHL